MPSAHLFPAFGDGANGRGRFGLPVQKKNPGIAAGVSKLVEEKDRREMVEAVKVARDIASRSPLAKYSNGEVSPGANLRTDDEILEGVRQHLTSGFHPAGTCKMGPDGDRLAVLDARLRVRGVEGMRVVDASAMPALTTGNTNVPVIMMAEKAADMCREDRVRAVA